MFVAYTNKSEFHAYSLPHLEHLHTSAAIPTPPRCYRSKFSDLCVLTSYSLRSISIDEHGDFISFDVHPSSGLVQSATYGTLFNFRRANERPLVDLVNNKAIMPPQPQPVPIGPPSLLGSWFKPNTTMSGQQVDGLCTCYIDFVRQLFINFWFQWVD